MPPNMLLCWKQNCLPVPEVFQDDNAFCHRAKLMKRWMQSHRVAQMNRPVQSPDLNPIENL